MKKRKRTSPLLILFRILFTCCLIYSVVFIFQNSLQIAAVSSERSEQVREVVNKAAATVGMGPFSLHVIRKMAHFTEFMMMGFWFMLCLRVYTRHFIRHISWPMFFGLATAVSDETIQLFVDGRGSSVKDVWIDFGGFLVGLFVALCILMFLRMCRILFIHRHDDYEPDDEEEEAYQEEQQEEPEPLEPPQRPQPRYAPEPDYRRRERPQTRRQMVTDEEEEFYDTNLQY